MGGIWVFCEWSLAGVRGVSHELIGEAKRLGGDATAVLIGNDVEKYAEELAASGADRVLLVEGGELDPPEELRHAAELARLIRKYAPEIVLIGATAFGRNFAPRAAAKLRTGLTADCTRLDIDPGTGLLLQTRPAFGGNLLATITCPDARPQMATVRPKVFPRPIPDPARPAVVVREAPGAEASPVRILERIAGEKSLNIGDFDVLVSVGMGIGGAKNIALAEKLAERLNGALSASRPVVDAGLAPYFRQVGQTGKAVSPKLYLALGISGAIQHMAGVGAETLVAGNTDPDAPIFQHADYGMRMDCGRFLEEVLEKIDGG